jgi:hypothetical protein
MTNFIKLNIANPDFESISQKEEIDISLSLLDVSASGQLSNIQTNYSVTSTTITLPDPNTPTTSSYYTPIYKEKLNYNVWLSRVNKNFEELD